MTASYCFDFYSFSKAIDKLAYSWASLILLGLTICDF